MILNIEKHDLLLHGYFIKIKKTALMSEFHSFVILKPFTLLSTEIS